MCLTIILENEMQCVLSYVVMENIIFPSLPRLLGCFPVSDVGFFIDMIECAFVSLLFHLLRGILHKRINCNVRFLTILMMSSSADSACCKVVWNCLVRYTTV